MKNITLNSSALKTLTTLALAASSLFAGSALANNAQDNGWVQTHTAQETYLNSRHLYCDYMDLESAKAECEDHNECNGFNFRVSDHTVCFKAADTNANGEALPEYHPNGTGYDVWVKNPEQDSAEQEVDPASYCGEHMGWDSDGELCIIQPEYTTAKAQCDTELAQVQNHKSSCDVELAHAYEEIHQMTLASHDERQSSEAYTEWWVNEYLSISNRYESLELEQLASQQLLEQRAATIQSMQVQMNVSRIAHEATAMTHTLVVQENDRLKARLAELERNKLFTFENKSDCKRITIYFGRADTGENGTFDILCRRRLVNTEPMELADHGVLTDWRTYNLSLY